MKLKVAIAVICVIALGALFVGCSNDDKEEPATEVETSIGSVSYKGSELYVNLEENLASGYEWSYTLDGESVMFSKVEFIGDEAGEESNEEEQAVGAGGERRFFFDGSGEGDTIIEFVHKQVSEGGEIDKVLKIKVSVGPDSIIQSVTEISPDSSLSEAGGETGNASGE